MKQFGAFEAKTHFSEILSQVIEGEKIIITRHGVQVAMIIPFVEQEVHKDPVQDAIRAIKKQRKGLTLGKKITVRQMLEEGRK